MLPDDVVEKAAETLATYRKNDGLAEILDQYATLIDDYKRLKSDYEEEREGRERYKQLARGHERKPFALVIVDGNEYVFDKSFITAGEEGGSAAAKQLHDAIHESLLRKGLEHCDMIVRVYANLANLSTYLFKTGLCGSDKRSLAPFVASFNGSYGLTDFIDAGVNKENVNVKLKAMLRLCAENAQCKHIYFAACHDIGYIADLAPHKNDTTRFTLISAPSVRVHQLFKNLEMRMEELPDMFQANRLMLPSNYQAQVSVSAILATLKGPMKRPGSPSQPSQGVSPADGDTTSFYPAGKSRFGRSNGIDDGDAKSTGQSFSFSPLTTSPSLRTRKEHPRSPSSISGVPSYRYNVNLLPEEVSEAYVAVNVADHRLDTYMRHPGTDDLERLRTYSTGKRLCNNYQLTGSCAAEHCPYSHSHLPMYLKPALAWLSRTLPCDMGGMCRRANCIMGHVCQKPDCKHRGGTSPCRFPLSAASEDYKLSKFIRTTPQSQLAVPVKVDASPKPEFGMLNRKE